MSRKAIRKFMGVGKSSKSTTSSQQNQNRGPSPSPHSRTLVQQQHHHPHEIIASHGTDSRTDDHYSMASTARSSGMNGNMRVGVSSVGVSSVPSSISQQHQHAPPDDFQLKMEVAELRNRIKLLDTGTSKSELLDLLQEKDAELEKKNEQIAILNQKFHQITVGLEQIEQERKTLRQTAKTYQEETTQLKRDIENRDSEKLKMISKMHSMEDAANEAQETRSVLHQLQQQNMAMKQQLEKAAEDQQKIALYEQKLRELSNFNRTLEHKLTETVQARNSDMESAKKAIAERESVLASTSQREEQLKSQISHLQNEKNGIEMIYRKKLDETKDDYQEKMQNMNQTFGQRELESENRISRERMELVRERDMALNKIREQDEAHHNFTTKLKDEVRHYGMMSEELKAKLDSDGNEIVSLRKRVGYLESENEAKERVLNGLRSEIDQKDSEWGSLNARITDLANENRSLKEENQVIEELETQLKNLLNSLNKVQEDHKVKSGEDKSTIEDLQAQVNEKDSIISDLNTQIDSLQDEIDENKQMEDVLELKLNDIEKLISDKDDLIQEKDDTLDDLQNQLDLIMDESKELKDDIVALQKDLRKAKDDAETAEHSLVSKEVEFKTTAENLKKSKDLTEKLIIQLEDSKAKLDTSDMQAAEIVNDLEEQLEKTRKQLDQMEKERDDQNRMLRGMQMQLMGSMGDKEKTEKEMQGKVDSMKVVIKSLEREYQVKMEEKEKELLDKAGNLSRKESEAVTLKIQLEQLKNAKVKQEETIQTLNTKLAGLNRDYKSCEQRESSAKSELDDTISRLEKRTALLGDMVSQNKALDSDLLEARMTISELQEELDMYLEEKDLTENTVNNLKRDMSEKEREALRNLREEHELCESLKKELKETQIELEDARLQAKDYSKMELQNEALRDKISRQEAYLSRLLQKQQKTRTVGASSSVSVGGGESVMSSRRLDRAERLRAIGATASYGALSDVSGGGGFESMSLGTR